MSQLYYTRRQVLMLQVEISDMIKSVVRDFLSNTDEFMGKKKRINWLPLNKLVNQLISILSSNLIRWTN